MTLLLLLACKDHDPKDSTPGGETDADTDADSDTDADTDVDTGPFEETLDPDEVHVLVSSSPAQGDPGHPLAELSVTLDERWTHDFDDADGSGGAIRLDDGTTVYARASLPPDFTSALEAIDADGNLLWSESEFFEDNFAFAHGVVRTPDGDYIIVDTVLARVISVSQDGEIQWRLPFVDSTGTRLPNGIDIRTGDDGVTRIVVTLLYRTGVDESDQVQVYTLGGRTDEPTLEWSFSGEQGPAERLWPHGPRFVDDHSVTVNYAARGQIALLDDGAESWIVPEVTGKLAFPRDMVVLPDGTWLIADAAAEVLRVYDPFGRFEIVDAAFVPGVFGLLRVDCAVDGGLPCLGSP